LNPNRCHLSGFKGIFFKALETPHLDKLALTPSVKLDEVIKIVKSLGVNASLSKCGVSNALKNIPLNPERWHLFGFKWEDKYYFYTRLCFGYRSSPNIISYMWPFVGFCRIIII
jgi:hypothetical protein